MRVSAYAWWPTVRLGDKAWAQIRRSPHKERLDLQKAIPTVGELQKFLAYTEMVPSLSDLEGKVRKMSPSPRTVKYTLTFWHTILTKNSLQYYF